MEKGENRALFCIARGINRPLEASACSGVRAHVRLSQSPL